MTQEQFFQLIKNPQQDAAISTKELAQLVQQFPYSQPLRFIYLKQLKEQNSVHYNQQLKLTAIYAPDRSKLFNYVHEQSITETEMIADVVSIHEIKPETESNHQPFYHTETKQAETEEEIIAPLVTLDEKVFFTEEISNETSVKQDLSIEEKEPISDVEEAELSPQDIINQRLRELNISHDEVSHLPVLPEIDEIIVEEPFTGSQSVNDFRHQEIIEVESEKEEEKEIAIEHPKQVSETIEEEEVQSLKRSEADDIELEKEIVVENTSEVFKTSEVLGVVEEEEPKKDFEVDDIELPVEQTSEVSETNETNTPSTENLLNELILENLVESQFYKSELLMSEDDSTTVEPSDLKPKKKLLEELAIPLAQDAHFQNPEADSIKPHSFTEWLRIAKRTAASSIKKEGEEKHLSKTFSESENHTPTDRLIDKFIEEEPRITPAKSNFYSPVNMARKSVKDSDELVSETLARIYATQGSYEKSIATYEKLLLKYPEKKTYFAPLIQNLKEKLNS